MLGTAAVVSVGALATELVGAVAWAAGAVIPIELAAAATPAGVSIAGSDEMKPEASGWWMFASAARASAAGWTARKSIADGSGITIPIAAARRSIR